VANFANGSLPSQYQLNNNAAPQQQVKPAQSQVKDMTKSDADQFQAQQTQAQQQAFFSHRLSNSNTNLKHIIKNYKDDNTNT